jgi:predicted glycoside hydrolase/deacetylase ChbG (UPF0249 family)
MTKRIVLCADDYGQDEAVSRGILDLLAAGRLTAVSCLVNAPDWLQHSQWLFPFKDLADIGLHLNFTDGNPLSDVYRANMGEQFMPLSGLLRRTVMRSRIIKPVAIAAEINAQLDKFVEAMGCMPRFIDGHQHVHHLPVISDTLLEIYRERLQTHNVYLRAVTQEGRLFDIFVNGLKNAVIHCTGGADFAARLDRQGIPHNTSFAGIYSFNNARQYRDYFQQFLQESANRGLIMCHPGHPAKSAADPISQARSLEYDYIKSAEFTGDCERGGVILARFYEDR